MAAFAFHRKIRLAIPALLTFLVPATAHAQTRIRLATLLPRGGSHYQILEGMGQQWRTVSGGSIRRRLAEDPDGVPLARGARVRSDEDGAGDGAAPGAEGVHRAVLGGRRMGAHFLASTGIAAR